MESMDHYKQGDWSQWIIIDRVSGVSGPLQMGEWTIIDRVSGVSGPLQTG